MAHVPGTEAASRRFDGVAELYALYRPSYPEVLVDALLALTGIPIDGKILEVETNIAHRSSRASSLS